MLLDVQDYVDLVKRADIPKSKGTLLCYILDETESTTDLISRLASETGLVPFRGNSRVEDWSAPLAERIQPWGGTMAARLYGCGIGCYG